MPEGNTNGRLAAPSAPVGSGIKPSTAGTSVPPLNGALTAVSPNTSVAVEAGAASDRDSVLRELSDSGPLPASSGRPPLPVLARLRSAQGVRPDATVRVWSAATLVSSVNEAFGQSTRSLSTDVAVPRPKCADSSLVERKFVADSMTRYCLT